MKKIFATLASIVLTVMLALGCSCNKIERFHLDDEFYTSTNKGFKDVDSFDYIQDLIDDDDSFIVYVHSFTCASCQKFTPIFESYLNNNNLQVIRITISTVNATKNVISDTKNLMTPSVFLFEDGKYVTHLDPNNEEHAVYFTSEEEFGNWLTTYIYLTKD